MVKGQKLVAKVIIEILGAPKEHVEKTIEIVLDKDNIHYYFNKYLI